MNDKKTPAPIHGAGASAGDNGFEPLLADPESAVLPLDESPSIVQRAVFYHANKKIATKAKKRQGEAVRFALSHKMPALDNRLFFILQILVNGKRGFSPADHSGHHQVWSGSAISAGEHALARGGAFGWVFNGD